MLETSSIELSMRKWLHGINLEKSNVIVVSRLSRRFEKNVISYIKESVQLEPMHFFSFHLSLDHAASLVLSRQEGKPRNFEDLMGYGRLIFLHDVEDMSSIRKFVSTVRSNLEKKTKSTIVLILRPATAYSVYRGTRAPLYGRVVKIEEPSLSELGIDGKNAEESGFLDLYEAYSYDNFNREKAIKSFNSASFNVLNLFWHFLINDSRKAGSVRVVASCVAYHKKPMTISEIDRKCGIKHGRQAVHAALKTQLMKITKGRPKRAYIYPPLLKSWIKINIPFYPI